MIVAQDAGDGSGQGDGDTLREECGVFGVFGNEDAAALTADPALTEPARNAARAVAGHLADLIRRAQAEGGIRAGADPEAAAWLLLSVLSARRLRAAAMPDSLEPGVTALALQALAPPAAAAGTRDQPPAQGGHEHGFRAASPVPPGWSRR